MTAGKVLMTALKIVAVCLVFASCSVVGGALSGLNKIGQQAPPAQQAVSSEPQAPGGWQAPQRPENLLLAFLLFFVCAGVVLSYLILRSSWHGWPLVGAICVGMYGISTVGPQLEFVFFLSNKLPRGLIRALFLQGAICHSSVCSSCGFVVGQVACFGGTGVSSTRPHGGPSAASRLALIVIAFVVLYMFFGYYVAWQSPAVRRYYGGHTQASTPR